MIKLIHCLRRLPRLSRAEFQSHWLEHHRQFGQRSPPAAVEAYDDERNFIDHARPVNVLTRRHGFRDLVR